VDSSVHADIHSDIGSYLERLFADGFAIRNCFYYPDEFGNFVIDLRRGNTEIRIVRDRGQYTIDGIESKELLTVGLWKAFDSSDEFFDVLFRYLKNAT